MENVDFQVKNIPKRSYKAIQIFINKRQIQKKKLKKKNQTAVENEKLHDISTPLS